MEPVSATLGIVSATVTLAGLALTIGKTLTAAIKFNSQSRPQIYALISACKGIEVAWNRISTWLETYSFSENEGDGQIVLAALQQDVEPYLNARLGQNAVSGIWRALLGDTVLRDHCARLNLQISSLHLLLATAELPQPKARNLVCDCLRPVFRKDEESAWTIVASRAASSRASFDSMPNTEQNWGRTMWSDTSFSFTNDLLTAPVYKRLVVSLLRSPTSSNKVQGVSCSAPVTADSDCHSITAHTHAGSIRTSCITVTKPQSLASTTTNHIDTADENLVELASDAAAGIFSSSAVADLDRLLPASGGLGLNLPIRASLSREQLTLEEQAMLDTQFLAAAKSESLLKMAEALDAGADINAVDPKTYQTALQIGITKETCCLAVRFLLQYKNVNFHVRDATGANLLHHAVNRNCGDCTQNLLDVGISMTDKDCFGFPALKVAIEKSYGSARPLLVMLRHATSRGFKRSFIIALHSSALYEQCLRYSHPHPMNYVPRDLELSMRLLIRFGWPLMSYVKTAEPLLGLLKEPSLLEELTSQRETLEHIRAKHPMWDEVLLAATKGAKANTRVVLALLRAGIEYQHVMTEIRELATKEQDSTLLGFLDRSHTSWYWSENDATELIMRENSYVFPILELDAVETQIAHRRSEQRAKEEETQGLQLALTALQHLRHANRLFEEDAWKDPLPTSLMQAVL